MCSKIRYPGGGGINGTTTKNKFDAKKTQIAPVYARNGGFQPEASAVFGRECMYKSPAEISAFTRAKG